MTLIKITLKNQVPTYKNKEVILSTIQDTVLRGKGERGYVLIHATNLIFKENGRENNKQDTT